MILFLHNMTYLCTVTLSVLDAVGSYVCLLNGHEIGEGRQVLNKGTQTRCLACGGLKKHRWRSVKEF